MWRNLRVGTGFDVHGFEEGRPLWIGGVQIPHSEGLSGHSDADVLLHAIVDALLGSLGLGDIGQHFPSSDPQWRGAASSDFVIWTRKKMQEMSVDLVSLDCCVIAQAPRLSPYVKAMADRISELLETEASRVHVKATTTDHLGFVGRQEGIAALAHCLVYRQKS